MIDPKTTPADQDQVIDLAPLDQTGFGAQEPIFEQPPTVVDPNQPVVVHQPWFKSRRNLILIAVGVVMVLLVLLDQSGIYFIGQRMSLIVNGLQFANGQ